MTYTFPKNPQSIAEVGRMVCIEDKFTVSSTSYYNCLRVLVCNNLFSEVFGEGITVLQWSCCTLVDYVGDGHDKE